MNTFKQLKLGIVTLASIGMIAACGGGSSSGSSGSSVSPINNVTGTTTCPNGLDLVFGQHFASKEDRMRLATGADVIKDALSTAEVMQDADPLVVVLTGDLARAIDLGDGQVANLSMVVKVSEDNGSEVIMFAYVDQEEKVVSSIPLIMPYITDYITKSLDTDAYKRASELLVTQAKDINPVDVFTYLEEHSAEKAKDFLLQRIYAEISASGKTIPTVYVVIDDENDKEFSNIDLGNMKWNGTNEEKMQAEKYSNQIHQHYAHLLIDYNKYLEEFVNYSARLSGVSDEATVGDVKEYILGMLEDFFPDLELDLQNKPVEYWESFDWGQISKSKIDKEAMLKNFKGLKLGDIVPRNLRSDLNVVSQTTQNWLVALDQYTDKADKKYSGYSDLVENTQVLSSAVSALNLAEILLAGLFNGTISLKGYGVDDACMALIADTVDFDVFGNAVTSLDLSNNKLGPDGLRAILQHFDARDANGNRMHGLSISSINISGNEMITEDDVNKLIEEFSRILGDGLFTSTITIYLDETLFDTHQRSLELNKIIDAMEME